MRAAELSFPQGIRDPVLPIAYVQTQNSVAAIRLADGEMAWSYPTPGRPIAVVGERLAIQVTTGKAVFRIDVLDKGTGILVVRSEPTAFSQSSGFESEGTQVPSVTARQSDQTLFLEWRIRRRYRGGANPPPDFAKPSESVVRARMDLKTGKIESEPSEVSSAQSIPTEKKELKQGGSTSAYIRDGEWSDTPWSTNDALVRLYSEGSDPKGLILEINRPKESSLTHKVLLTPGQIAQPPYVTDDGDFVLVQTTDGWAVYSSNDGRQIGTFAANSVAEPLVLGNRVYYRSLLAATGQPDVEKTEIICQDLLNGKVMWSRTLSVMQRGHRPKLPQ